MSNAITSNNLRKVLNQLYDYCSADFGAWTLACVLDNIDISRLTKKELDVIYRFIDNPEHLQKPMTENVPVSKDSEIRFAYHLDNLIFLLSNLSSFEFIDPEKSKNNVKIGTAIAEQFTDGVFERYSKEWNVADVEERKAIIKKSYALITEESKLKPPLRFEKGKGYVGSFDDQTGILYWEASNAYAKKESYTDVLCTLVHELIHAEQSKAGKYDNDLKRLNTYYVYLEMDRFAYFGNYIEQEAFHREEVFTDKLLGESYSRIADIKKMQYLSEKTR